MFGHIEEEEAEITEKICACCKYHKNAENLEFPCNNCSILISTCHFELAPDYLGNATIKDIARTVEEIKRGMAK